MSSILGSTEPEQAVRKASALTTREQTILEMLAQGMRNREISQELEITERTVKFHVSRLFAKLGASNRTEVVRLAFERRLLRL